MAKQIEDKISLFVEDHFPDFYKESGPEFVAFVKAYYEFLEQDEESLGVARNLLSYHDVDETITAFASKFKEQYLKEIPLDTAVDTSIILKHMMDLYKSKGSARAIELLFRLVYGEEARVVFPSDQVLTASDADYKEPKYLEVIDNDREYLISLQGKKIEGSISLASAFCDSIATKIVNGREIQVLYISGVEGQFQQGELIATPLRSLEGAPEVLGSLSSISITMGGKDYELGQYFDVTSDTGKGIQGVVKATTLVDATGVVDFELDSANTAGGFGFSTNTSLTNTSVATSMLLVNNFVANVTNAGGTEAACTDITTFPIFETLVQPLETVNVVSAGSNFFANTGAGLVGARVRGTSTSGNITSKVVANGIVAAFTNASAAAGQLTICVDEGTFGNQGSLTYSGNGAGTTFEAGEPIDEGSDVTLTVASTTGFTAGDVITANTTGANGTIQAITNSTVMTLNASFGTFTSAGGEKIDETGGTANTVIATNGVDITTSGANASITSITNSTVMVVDDVVGAFTANKKFKGRRSGVIANVASFSTTGSVELFFGSGGTTNVAQQSTMANSYVTANIIGSNTANTEAEASGTGVFVGAINSAAFSNSQGTFVYANYKIADSANLKTKSTVNATGNLVSVYTGVGAAYAVANVEDDEVLTLYTDFVSDNNSANVAFLDCKVGGSNTGVGFVDTGLITTAGSGYAAGDTVTWSSNGIGGGLPTTNAVANISSVGGSGEITGITMTNHGAGFYTNAGAGTITTSGGSSGVVTARMDFGYGFPKDPQLGLDDFIGKALNIDSGTFGTITRLGSFNPGSEYNITPFFNLISKNISKFDRRDLIITLNNRSGDFVDNEYVTQTVTTAKQRLTNTTAMVVTGGAIANVQANDTAVQVVSATVNTTATVDAVNSTTITFRDVKTKNSTGYVTTTGAGSLFGVNTTANTITVITNSTSNAATINARSTAHTTSNVSSTVDAKGKTKGTVFEYTYVDDSGNEQSIEAIKLSRKSFGVTINPGLTITGSSSGATGNVLAQIEDVSSSPIGHNANVTANSTVANNRVSEVTFIDSGFGYTHGDVLTLTPQTGNTDILATGTATVNSYGVGEGYWGDTKSFIGEQKLHDNDKYQEYSYEVISKLSVDKYEEMLKKLLHVGGTKLFGSVETVSSINLASSVASSNIATA